GIPHHGTPPTTPPSPSSSVASFGSPPPAPLIPPRNGRQNSFAIVEYDIQFEDTNIKFN
ncbi:MAG: hypothetical protein EZS28_036158, partial [Streblomastix strix]